MPAPKPLGQSLGWPSAGGLPAAIPFHPRLRPINASFLKINPRRADLITMDTAPRVRQVVRTGQRAVALTCSFGGTARPKYTSNPAAGEPGLLLQFGSDGALDNFWTEHRWVESGRLT